MDADLPAQQTARAAGSACAIERSGNCQLIELGYLSLASKGDAKAKGIAIEAYLADSL
jgi:hypothetical protein